MLVPVVIVAALQVRFFPTMRETRGTDHAIGYVAGRIVGTLLISLLIAWIAWLVSRRSRRAANYAFVITVLLMGLASLSMDKTETALGSKAMAAQLDSLLSKRAALETAQKRLNEAGGVNLRLPRDASEAAERLALLDEMSARLRELIEAGDRAPLELMTRLTDARIQPDQRGAFVRKFEEDLQLPAHRTFLLAVERSCSAGRNFLVFLRDRPGEWSVDPTKDDIVMKSAADAEQFDRLWNAFAAAIEAVQQSKPPSKAQSQQR